MLDTKHKIQQSFQKQRGAALILSLILLLVMTLLALSSTRTATMEEKMANNMRDINLAFEAAESGLREAETWIEQQTTDPARSNGNAFVYKAGALPNLANRDHAWWTSADHTATYGEAGSSALEEVHTQPRFVIEHRAFISDSLVRGYEPPTGKNIYRAAARGTGVTDTAQSITETTFAKRFN